MKKLFFSLSLIIILLTVYFSIINSGSIVELTYLKGTELTSDMTVELKVSLYTILVLFAGLFSGAGIMSLFIKVQEDKIKAYKRELEKSTVTKEASSSKVDVLEAKIKTLEKAFTSVVDERTKLEVQIKDLNAEIDSLNKSK